jgi:hypothetical protein
MQKTNYLGIIVKPEETLKNRLFLACFLPIFFDIEHLRIILALKSIPINNTNKYLDKLSKCPDEKVWEGIISKLEEFAMIEYEFYKSSKLCKL